MRKTPSIRGVLRRIALIVLPEPIWVLRRIGLIVLPEPIFYRLLHYITRQRPRTALETASDRRKISPQEDVELWIYWRNAAYVRYGPSASLFVLREEVLRLDCYGGSLGHMHLNPQQQGLTCQISSGVQPIEWT